MKSSRGFSIRCSKTGKSVNSHVTYHSLKISCKNNQFVINGKKFSHDELCIVPYRGGTTLNNNFYDGSFLITKQDKSCYLINMVESESYVYSVLKTESWPGWPLEINKVMAVASRSYLLYQMLQARKNNRPYHIKNTNFHQTYAGLHGCPVIKKAVQETRNMFLSHEGEPILAMFDCCCGGIVPKHIEGIVDFKKAPYLARSYACKHCKECKIYSWEVDYSLDEFRDTLQNGVDSIIHKVKDVKIAKRDKAGVVQEVVARTKKRMLTLTSKSMYQLFKEVKSYAFSVHKKSKKITIKGRGYGHHIGLCQWGARSMVDKGWDYKSILEYYYPKTTFMQLDATIKKV